MLTFDSDGVRIAFVDEGEGEPVLLVHGFASNVAMNWVGPGWLASLREAGYRVIAFDHRGHGESEKLYESAAYELDLMAADARRLLDHCGVERASVVGYSMGARVSALLAADVPGRVRALALGGVGMNLVTAMRNEEAVAEALLAEDAEATVPPGRRFRKFADKTGSDRRALAACILSQRRPIGPDLLARIGAPTLVAVGGRDEIAAGAEELVRLIPQASLLKIPDRDHMTVVGDTRLRAGVIDFLGRHA